MNAKTALSAVEIARYRQSFQQRAQKRLAAHEERREQARQAARNAITIVMPRYPMVQRVYLFGSVVRPGAFRSSSDIDVGIEGADMALCFDIWRDLERTAAGWQFDVRLLESEDPFSERVRQKGEVVYEHATESP